MNQAVMPKGVEHKHCNAKTRGGSRVNQAVMPKGVEHYRLERIRIASGRVNQAVMPKGVEHECSIVGGRAHVQV